MKINIKDIIIIFLIAFSIIGGVSLIVNVYNSKISSYSSDDISSSKDDSSEENNDYESELSMIMVGDALIHKSIYLDAQDGDSYDFRKMMTRIKKITKDYDIAYYNQETILGGTELGLSTYPRFNSPYEVGDAFIDAGFNLVSLANNHSYDRGKKAISNSVRYWNKHKDVLTAGTYLSELERIEDRIVTKNDISYTMLSYTMDTNGITVPQKEDYLVNIYDKDRVKEDIERVRDKVDFLIVAMHWGQEYTNTPVQSQKDIANYLASLGVDLIIGCHPHVIEPVDFIDKTMVIYSLGNFISSQNGPNNLTGLMMSIKIHKKVSSGKKDISILDPTARLIYTYYKEGNPRNSYMVYPYEELNNDILSNYENHYEKFMNIVTMYSEKIAKYPLNP